MTTNDQLPAVQPAWWVYVLLPALHFASAKLTFATALSPENEVVVWLPNAVLLAALLHFRGHRAWLMAALTFSSDVIANLPVFPPTHAVALSVANFTEVVVAYLLMQRMQASPALERIQDFGRFVVAGPLLGALCSALIAANVLRTLPEVSASYSALLLLWWYGDALGLLIYVPLLLTLARPSPQMAPVRWWDTLVVLITVALALLIFSGQGERIGGSALLTPNLLMPSMLFIAVRFGTRWAALSVAVVALAAAWAQTTGHKPFGDASPHVMILRTQEFILTLSLMCMGFAIVFTEQRALTRGLEGKVRERTRELEATNQKLSALTITDELTGIANRRRFGEVLATEWARAKRAGVPLALSMVDVDWFKPYNDRYGHQAGDDCLRFIAHELADHARRAGDLAARYGGEEFVIVGPGAGQAGALAMAQDICNAVQQHGRVHEESPLGVITVSIGVAVLHPADGGLPEQLLQQADDALYQAKRRGRNRVVMAGQRPVAVPS